jgi:hypothetical protein
MVNMQKQPGYNPADLPSWYRLQQMQNSDSLPLFNLMTRRVNRSKKASARLEANQRARKKLKEKYAKQGWDSDRESDDSDLDDIMNSESYKPKCVFYDPKEVWRRMLQWPGNIEHFDFIPTRRTDRVISQLSNSSVHGSLPQYTAQSVHVPALGERLELGRHIVYTHNGDRQVGEIIGIFRLSDSKPYDNVTGGAVGGTQAALERMRAYGGGVSGNPVDTVDMVFQVRPFACPTALRSLGQLHLPP